MTQTWDPQQYQSTAAFVPALGAPVLALLGPQPGEHILDLGCGDGVLTAELVAAGADVVGVDASAEMVDAAVARGLEARVMDATELAFSDEFDAVFSNAVLHWLPATESDEVLRRVARALHPGGRFVAELGGHGCVAAVATALSAVLARRGIDAADVSPWYFPTVDDYGARLVAAGFAVDTIELIPRPTPLPGDVSDWIATFGKVFLAALPADEREAATSEAVVLLRPWLCDDRGRWTADYIRLRFAAHLPG
ncbi:MAG: methyltransferase domain-containing protein [Acidimicrobiales bacterium]